MRKPFFLFLFILVFFVAGKCFAQQGNAAPAEDTGVLRRLDAVLKNQEIILKKLGEIREQVEVVKIRATR